MCKKNIINGATAWRVRALPCLEASQSVARALASGLRPADAREVWAAGGRSPAEAVRESLRRSLEPGERGRAWAVLIDESCVMAFGVAPVSPLSEAGVPWMLATEAWDAFMAGGLNLAFARRCRGYVAEMGRGFARLENQVHAENGRAIRWLEWLGFRLDPPAPWGVRGEMFQKFWKVF